jgi:type IV secretory pathway VirB4 component|tara:strand:- start:49 stop:690 length:642 start_codon:yes stop_codon:yes gene_type:complete
MADNKSTQKFLPIKEIRDGVVILNNGSIKTILLASSLNFALKSAEEQQSVLSQFQNFLNSFSFPVQFFIQSRRLDIRPYILTLEERHQKQTDELMKLQIKEYIKFVKEFTTDADVMSKNFFVVVGYQPPVFDTSKGIVGRLFNKKTSKKDTAKDRFKENKTQLDQRISVVRQGLVRSGVRTTKLGTEELVELFFTMFNPGELKKPANITGQES